MKIIFLDIDGVLATDESAEMPNHEVYSYPFDKDCVNIFNEILTQTSAEIVLTSDWRFMYNEDLVMLDALFKHNGIIKSPIDTTPNLSNRQKEIESYISSNGHKFEKYVVLDDANIKLPDTIFIKCGAIEGLKEVGLKEKAIDILMT